MASRAIGAAFGGLAEFLRQNRALNQNTEDREFLAKNRDLSLRGGEQDIKLGGVRLGREQFQADRDPTLATQHDTKFLSDIAGPTALKEALTSDPQKSFGSGISAASMLPGLQKQIAREDVGDRIQGSQATLQGNAAERSGLSLGALRDVQANPGDPINNQADVTRYALAGVPEATRPAAGTTNQWMREAQDDQQQHGASLQASSQEFSREMNLQDIPPGVDPQVHRGVAEPVLKSFQQNATALKAQIASKQRELLESRALVERARAAGMPSTMRSQAVAAQDSMSLAQSEMTAALQELRALGEQTKQALQGMGAAHPSYDAIIAAMSLGTDVGGAAKAAPTTPSPSGPPRRILP